MEIIGNLVNQFNVKQAVADIGYGEVEVSELKKMFAGRVLGYQCVRRPELSLERETTGEYGNKIAQLYLLAGRSFWIISAIGLLKFKDKNEDVWPHMIIPYGYPANVEWFFDLHQTVNVTTVRNKQSKPKTLALFDFAVQFSLMVSRLLCSLRLCSFCDIRFCRAIPHFSQR